MTKTTRKLLIAAAIATLNLSLATTTAQAQATKKVSRMSVIEEFTGTWCGWCPRGITGLERIQQEFPGQVITIAVHTGDPMYTVDYAPILRNVEGLPYATVDREGGCDPYYGMEPTGVTWALDQVVEMTLAEEAIAEVTLEEPSLDINGNIELNTLTTFYVDEPTAHYALAYILVGDSLSGTTAEWTQTNYFANYTQYGTDEWLKAWTEAPYAITGMKYNHVALLGKGIDTGVEGSVASPIVSGEAQAYNTNMSVATNALVDQAQNLRVVVLLLDTETGFIVNATERGVKLPEYSTDYSLSFQRTQFADQYLLRGTETTVRGTVENVGQKPAERLSYVVNTDGNISGTRTIEFDEPLEVGQTATIDFVVEAGQASGVYTKSIVINRVNGEFNNAQIGGMLSGTVVTLARKSPHKVLVEDFFDISYGECMRGKVATEVLQRDYADICVPVSVHVGDDPLANYTYSEVLADMADNLVMLPFAYVDRYWDTDPYYGDAGFTPMGITQLVKQRADRLSVASIELKNLQVDEEKTQLSFDCDVTFQMDYVRAPYALGFLLLADSLSNPRWTMDNDYRIERYYGNDPYLSWLVDEPATLEGLVFNNVPVAQEGCNSGIGSSITPPLVEGQPRLYSGIFSLKGNPYITDTNQLKVVALLFDLNTYDVVNCEVASLAKHNQGLAAIQTVPTTAKANAGTWTLDGRKATSTMHGLKLTRQPDGSVRKSL